MSLTHFMYILIGMYVSICYVWQLYVKKKYGKTTYRDRDQIIGVIMSLVLALILYNVNFLYPLALFVAFVSQIGVTVWLILMIVHYTQLREVNKELERLIESKDETIKDYDKITDELIDLVKKDNQSK